MQASTALPEAECLVPTALHLPHHEDPQTEKNQHGNGVEKYSYPAIASRVLPAVLNSLFLQDLVNFGVIRRNYRMKAFGVRHKASLHVSADDFGLFNFPLLHCRNEIGDREFLRGICASGFYGHVN